MASLCTSRFNIQSAGVDAKYSEVCPTFFTLEREVKSGRSMQRTCRAPRSLRPRLSGVRDIVRISAFPFETWIELNNM